MISLIFLVVFLGWIMIWDMLPTKVYQNTWTPKLSSELNSTLFEGQGTNLLLFSFPVMFIAAFGSVYLHFQKKLRKPSYKSAAVSSNRLSFLKRPVLVVAPLGIVTATEIAFAAMFVALLIWSLANYLYVSFGHLHMHKEGEKIWQAKFRSVSLRLGYIGNICWAFLFFPVTRGSSVLALVGLTSESSIKYHIWLGHLSMILFAAHTIGFIIYWAMTNQMALMLEWSKTWVSNVAGEIAVVLALAMWVTSSHRIRRKMFESRQQARLLSSRLLPCGCIELNFSKSTGLYYNPTSILFLNVPSIAKLQWHPFTVTSNCDMEPETLSVVIKRQGSWSQKLYQEISSSVDRLEMSVEGPYGPTSSHFLRHELLMMVSGGSGITPFISIIRQIIVQSTQPNCQIPRIFLVCAFKKSADLAMLDLMLPINGTPAQITQLQLQIEAYITRETEQPIADTEKHLQTIWFKPNPSDSPITAALGPKNWLWLGTIIVSSFVMFLLLLGIVTRYYIFPIDQNTEEIYHFSYFVLWEMLLVCACVVIASSAAFFWCKKQNEQIQNLEVPTATASPGSGPYGADTELESLPHQSLVQATKVHFGARPDLNRILSECKGSDVGVLACGPRAMRHEVAKICSSGLADNLHFESISFDW
ncbi:ferric reduction oxidase 4 isoform X2 [Hevea brasiliensis]|uniref:ferric reduction oxidase 4 isoform X2 n=1 Tax=Hevea brasiliensis TaxID=3981 RepID=UPI0025F38EAE|nr:ferric reduction oxidase 4 isoform X2 [Hevea brasiliensis]